MRRGSRTLLWFALFATLAVFAVAQNDVTDDDGMGGPDDDGDDDGIAAMADATAAMGNDLTDDDMGGPDDDGDDDGAGVLVTTCPRTHPSVDLVVDLVDSAQKDISGTIWIVDDCTLRIAGFTYDGSANDAALVGSASMEGLGSGFVFLELEKGKVWNGTEVVIGELDDTVTWDDIVFISVWDMEEGMLATASLNDGILRGDDDDDGDGIDDDGVANNFNDDDDDDDGDGVDDDGVANNSIDDDDGDDDGDGVDDDGVANNSIDDDDGDDDGDGVDDDGIAGNFDDDGDVDDDGVPDK